MPGKKVLLVEGKDDENVIKHICGNRGVGQIEIQQEGNVEELLHGLPVRLKASDIAVLGVLLDADTDPMGRWQAVRQPLVQAGYEQVPETPAADGTVLAAPLYSLLPGFGVWMMPDNGSAGILEDFLRFLVPPESRLFGHVNTCVASIPEDERRFSKAAEPKAIIHTWLAWQKEPGRPLGTAITARFLDPDVPQVHLLAGWLKRLFFPAPSV